MGLNHSIQPRIRPLCCCLILAVNAMTGSAAWAEAGADEGADTELSQLPSPAPERDETLRNQAVEAQLALTDKATDETNEALKEWWIRFMIRVKSVGIPVR